MSGLNPDWDHILEVAVIITTPKLEIVAEGPNRIIHVSDTVLEAMDPWNTSHHGDSGLTQASRQSTNSAHLLSRRSFHFLRNIVFLKRPHCAATLSFMIGFFSSDKCRALSIFSTTVLSM